MRTFIVGGLLVTASLAGLGGCQHYVFGSNLQRLNTSMTSTQVIAFLGEPKDISRNGDVELLKYRLPTDQDDLDRKIFTNYTVRIVNGHVDAWGRDSDFFGSFAEPAAPQ